MTSASLTVRAQNGGVDEPDPAARARRRTFTAEYKARVLAEYEALPEHSGERGALVRREGLYSSHIAEWRKARDAAALDALEPKARPAKRTAEQIELEKLRRKNERLEAELARTKLALEITGKAHALLELISESAASDNKPTK
jgi:transposase-like protein